MLCTDRSSRTRRSSRSKRSLERSDVLVLAAPHSDYRTLVIPDGKPVVDVWNFFGKGAQPYVKILVTGSAGFIAGYLVEELLSATVTK